MIAFFYRLFVLSDIKKGDIPLFIIGGGSYLAFWIISLIFRRGAKPTFPWGIVFHILMIAAFSISLAVAEGGSIIASIILILIAVIPGNLIFSDNHPILGILYAVIVAIVGVAMDNFATFFFLALAVPAIPGIIIMMRTEKPKW